MIFRIYTDRRVPRLAHRHISSYAQVSALAMGLCHSRAQATNSVDEHEEEIDPATAAYWDARAQGERASVLAREHHKHATAAQTVRTGKLSKYSCAIINFERLGDSTAAVLQENMRSTCHGLQCEATLSSRVAALCRWLQREEGWSLTRLSISLSSIDRTIHAILGGGL